MVNVFFETSFLEYPDNESMSLIVSFSGCPHHCDGCHSPLSQIYEKPEAELYNNQSVIIGQKYYRFMHSEDLLNIVNDLLLKNSIKKLVLTGGDPMSMCNISYVQILLTYLVGIDVCVYTGFKPSEIELMIRNWFISSKTIFKCGCFKKELYQEPEKTDEYMQLASINQNFYKLEEGNQLKQISTNGKLYF